MPEVSGDHRMGTIKITTCIGICFTTTIKALRHKIITFSIWTGINWWIINHHPLVIVSNLSSAIQWWTWRDKCTVDSSPTTSTRSSRWFNATSLTERWRFAVPVTSIITTMLIDNPTVARSAGTAHIDMAVITIKSGYGTPKTRQARKSRNNRIRNNIHKTCTRATRFKDSIHMPKIRFWTRTKRFMQVTKIRWLWKIARQLSPPSFSCPRTTRTTRSRNKSQRQCQGLKRKRHKQHLIYHQICKRKCI